MLYANIRFFWGFVHSFFRSKSAVSGANFVLIVGKKLRGAHFLLHVQELLEALAQMMKMTTTHTVVSQVEDLEKADLCEYVAAMWTCSHLKCFLTAGVNE